MTRRARMAPGAALIVCAIAGIPGVSSGPLASSSAGAVGLFALDPVVVAQTAPPPASSAAAPAPTPSSSTSSPPTATAASAQATAPARLELRASDRIVLIGNTLAERQVLFNHFETLLMTRFPELRLSVRNLGWSGDTLTLQPRPLNFGDATTHLTQQRADVILAFFGLNESFDGEAGLPRFEQDLDAYLRAHFAARYNGRGAPRLALVSPIAHERLARLPRVDTATRNAMLARYTDRMRLVAARHGVPFVDLFTPTLALMTDADQAPGPGLQASGSTSPGPAAAGKPTRGDAATALTINGIHVTARGDRIIAALLMNGLGFGESSMQAPAGVAQTRDVQALRELIRDKNEQFFYRWRPVNAEYVVGRRVEPFGSVNFPKEMAELDRIVAERERTIWTRALPLKGVRFAEDDAASATTPRSAEARARD